MRKVTIKSLHKIQNISKQLIESTFSFSWWILASNLIFDALISKIENVSLHKKDSRNKFYQCWISSTCIFAQICNVQNVVFQVQMSHEMWSYQWCNDVTVNTHCDVTMGRWCCLGNHISQQWVGDVAAAQRGASVQLYYKALNTDNSSPSYV